MRTTLVKVAVFATLCTLAVLIGGQTGIVRAQTIGKASCTEALCNTMGKSQFSAGCGPVNPDCDFSMSTGQIIWCKTPTSDDCTTLPPDEDNKCLGQCVANPSFVCWSTYTPCKLGG